MINDISYMKKVSTLQAKQPVLLGFVYSSILLSHSPRAHYRYCFDEIVRTRSKLVVTSFHTALTIGGPNGTPRPIEMHAHDPLRYVGDMLAWLHQAVASEFELMNRVFGSDGIPLIPLKAFRLA